VFCRPITTIGPVTPVTDDDWKLLPLGAGGYIIGATQTPAGALAVRTDTYGAYNWNATASFPVGNAGQIGAFEQLVNSTSMPASETANPGTMPVGVLELQYAPSTVAPNIVAYMVAASYAFSGTLFTVYSSANGGATWTATNFTPVALYSGYWSATNGASLARPYKSMGPRMAIHPTNPDIMFVGIPGNGLFACTDGTNITAVSSSQVPVDLIKGSSYPGITGVLFAPNNGNIAVAWTYQGSTGGFYYTTNATAGASSTWTLFNSGVGPQSVSNAQMSATGVLWVADWNWDLWMGIYSGGSWTWTKEISATTSGERTAAVACNDPNNSSHVVAVGYDNIFNEWLGSSFAGWSKGPTWSQANETDIPWLAALNPYAAGANWLFFAQNQTFPNFQLIGGSSRSVWDISFSAAITTSTVPSWIDRGVGLEQIVANCIIIPPFAGASALAGGWDSNIFILNGTNYPLQNYPVSQSNVCGCWNIDYASSDPTFVVAICDDDTDGGNGLNQFCFGQYSVGTWSFTLFGQSGTTVPPGLYSSTANQASTKGVMIGLGSQNFAVTGSPSLPLVAAGQAVYIYETSNSANSMAGTVTSYSGGSLVIDALAVSGSGTFSDWTIKFVGGAHGCVAVLTPEVILWAPASYIILGLTLVNPPQITFNGGATWAPITLPGSPAFTSEGAFDGPIWACADRVNSTLYYWTPGVGWYAGVVSGSSITWTAYANTTASFSNSPRIAAVPGHGGHLLWNLGGGALWYCTNGEPSTANCTEVTNTYDVIFGIGAAAPGQSYPAIYLYGKLKFAGTTSLLTIGTSPLIAGQSQGFTVSTGLAATFAVGTPVNIVPSGQDSGYVDGINGIVTGYSGSTVTVAIASTNGSGSYTSWSIFAQGIWQNTTGLSATMPWTQIGPYANDSLDGVITIAGDMNVYGHVVLGFDGSGYAQIDLAA
jgi:hypothetical protein